MENLDEAPHIVVHARFCPKCADPVILALCPVGRAGQTSVNTVRRERCEHICRIALDKAESSIRLLKERLKRIFLDGKLLYCERHVIASQRELSAYIFLILYTCYEESALPLHISDALPALVGTYSVNVSLFPDAAPKNGYPLASP